MELPKHLAMLYRHWPLHTRVATSPTPRIDPELASMLSWFIRERLNIWAQKESGAPPPYTNDPILGTYRFCNIFREFDRQTIEFHELLNPLRDNFPLWLLNMFYCRMVARPETIRNVGLLSFDTQDNERVFKHLSTHPRPRFGTPYVFPISTIQKGETPTRELFITKFLPSVMREIAAEIETWNAVSVYDGVERILPRFGFNLTFLWTEVLIDTAYQYPKRLDLYERFPVGPGAAPTLARIDASTDPSILVAKLQALPVDTGITNNGALLTLSAENWEGICCEFRKYTNLSQGVGRRRRFR